MGSGELLRAKFALFQTNLAKKRGSVKKKGAKKGQKCVIFPKTPLKGASPFKKGLLGSYAEG